MPNESASVLPANELNNSKIFKGITKPLYARNIKSVDICIKNAL